MCICSCTFSFSFCIPTATVGSGKRGICSDRSDWNTCRPVRMLSPVQTDNIVSQQLPTLLDVTCCIGLHTLARPSSKKNIIEGIPVLWTCKIQGAQGMLHNFKESKIFWPLRSKSLRCHGPPPRNCYSTALPCFMLVHIVGSCCAKFQTCKTFEPTAPNISFVPWSPKRSTTFLHHAWLPWRLSAKQ